MFGTFKINDNFEFNSLNDKNKKSNQNNANNNKKIFDYEDEIVIDGLKEIQISKIEQFDKLME